MSAFRTLLFAVLTVTASPCWAQNAAGASGDPPPNPTTLASQADRQKMMDLLNITTLRRGADGNNKQSPFYANYDESKASPYSTLPDPLVMKNGKKVTTAAMWPARRAEIMEDFDREIYGRVPAVTPKVAWEVVKVVDEKNGDVPVITKTLLGHVDNSAYPAISVNIQLSLSTPANATGPVPVMMYLGPSAPGFPGAAFGFGGPLGGSGRGGFGGSGRGGLAFGGSGGGRGRGPAGPTWQQQVLAKGWGYATISTGSIQADNGAGLTAGIIGLVNKGQPRKPDDWGALRAWAWGASRALDYFETDKAVNAKMVGLEGHSRWGKGTIVAMAYDTRFAIAFVSSSGEGGARIHRRYFGEMVENVTAASEYHWMAGNFLKYGGPLTANDMPVDAHELVALCAPRPVFISGGADGDSWQDPKGMFLAAAGAQPVYRLLGKKEMGTMEFPPMETALIDGDIAFRQHSGGHTDVPNWPTFIVFASRYLR